MATCPATDGITQTEAACLFGKRPDILALFAGSGWNISPSNYIPLACEWWYGVKGGAPEGADTTLQAYVTTLGCRAGAVPVPPGADSLEAWVKQNVWAVIAAAVALGMFLRGR